MVLLSGLCNKTNHVLLVSMMADTAVTDTRSQTTGRGAGAASLC